MKSVVVAVALLVVAVAANRNGLREMESGLWSGVPAQWRALHRADPSTPIELTLAVKQQNLEALERALYAVSDPASPSYAQHYSRKEIDALVAPAEEDVTAVKAWLSAHGLNVSRATSNSDFLMLIVPVSAAEQLLHTQYWVYEAVSTSMITKKPMRITRANSAYHVPAAIADRLDFVSPTIHFPRVKKAKTRVTEIGSSNPDDLFVTPEFLRALYGVPATTRSTVPSNIQGVASFLEQYYTPSDLQEFFSLYMNTSVGQTVAKQIGDNDPTNPGTEAELDVQYIMGVGAGVQTWVYYTAGRAPNPENEPFLAWLTNLATEDTIPNVFSVSYGEDEKSVGTDYGGRVNVEFQKVGARGVSIMFAAGDDGAGGNCTASGRFSPDFPSGSPWVTAVGGLVGGTAGAVPTGETTDSISGGGFSDYWPMPAYQQTATQYYFNNAQGLPPAANWNQTGRGYPDVAAQSEMFVVVQGGFPLPGVGGTSCASPTFTGVISLLNDARLAAGKNALGFLNPLIYKIAPANVNAFNDVTEGSNMGCSFDAAFPAWAQWDAATGWGSPNYSLLKPIVLALP